MHRRRLLKLAGASLAAWPLRELAKDPPAPMREVVDGKEVVHGDKLVAKKPYPRHVNGVAKLPAWDGATTSDSVPGSMRMFRGNLAGTYYGSGKLPDQLRVVWKFRMSDFATTLRGDALAGHRVDRPGAQARRLHLRRLGRRSLSLLRSADRQAGVDLHRRADVQGLAV